MSLPHYLYFRVYFHDGGTAKVQAKLMFSFFGSPKAWELCTLKDRNIPKSSYREIGICESVEIHKIHETIRAIYHNRVSKIVKVDH